MLNVCNVFFNTLNSQKIRYCHWKSNSHLDKALNGETDLDLLVHYDDKSKFESVIERLKFKFKSILSSPEKQFPGMSDYLGFDDVTGKFIHLHLHYQLVLGEKYIKNHHLPLEEVFFENLVLSEYNVWIPAPELEFILLFIRAHMKVDFLSLLKHTIKDCMHQRYSAFPADIEKEFSDLIEQSDIARVKDLLRQCDLPLKDSAFVDFFQKFPIVGVRSFDIALNKWKILSELRPFRRQKDFFVYCRYFTHFIFSIYPFSKFTRTKRKTMNGPAKVISLVGADGSGKSTLVKDLVDWLSWKLEVKQVYHGIPKTLFGKALSNLNRVLVKLHLEPLASFIKSLRWVSIARTRYKNSLLSKRLADSGVMVVTDRFPLHDFHSMPEPMDGPRLNTQKNWLSNLEADFYQKIIYPDIVFVLQVDLDELRKRKTDLPLETHETKADAVNSIQVKDPIVLINANNSYQEVLLQIKRSIWSAI